ncbi:phosphoglycerate mutase-like protein [Pseudovirgaria hyperparasitica]|uniref:Phosphoglycerate mutase-like protein n=1 Tax=Pseudovirgaria hyperparasitica TaxID=470096 RepID=A0A6A6VVT2_9PEZI|nr:phosphoglycerate mutase-like protein [Pseudovirgaria hyperparasitica]KAF2753357.1 phosphoglycerate mutase-like protein [Pseudovirgaria hyperparasitica]
MTTPRVFIIRHGETEWSLNGRHTGTTELPLTSNGEARIRATGQALIGEDRLIAPHNLAHIYVSPRQRAQRTLELLSIGSSCEIPWKANYDHTSSTKPRTDANIEVTEDIREWDYGDYEGLTSKTIREERQKRGEGGWDIWRDGCPGGESPHDVTKRLDRLIRDIRNRFHEAAAGKPKGEAPACDVLLVAHGHILRAFAARWIGREIHDNPNLILEAGGVGTLSYEHHSIDEPAILLGGAFMSDVVENAKDDVMKR